MSFGIPVRNGLGVGLIASTTLSSRRIATLPLDNLVAAGAFSVRRLRSAYTGPLVRVRRSSDNLEADIGFGPDGWLNEPLLLRHCGENALRNSETILPGVTWQAFLNATAAAAGQDGPNNRWAIRETAATGQHRANAPSFSHTVGEVLTYAHVVFPSAGRTFVQISWGASVSLQGANFHLQGAGSFQLFGTGGAASITALPSGGYLISHTATATATGTGGTVFLPIALSLSDVRGGATYTGDPAFGYDMQEPRLIRGGVIKPYAATTGTALPSQDGFITTWYDQSVRAINLAQITPAAQPRIVNAGVVDTVNGRPTFIFSGAQWLDGVSAINLAQPITWAVVVTASGAPQKIFDSVSGTRQVLDTQAAGVVYRYFAGSTVSASAGSFVPNARAVLSVRYSVATSSLQKDGVQIGSGSAGTGAMTQLRVGRSTLSFTEYLNGNIPELIAAPLTPSERQTLERNQGAAFGVTVA